MLLLGCMEIIYEHVGLTDPKEELLAQFGPRWQVEEVVRFLASYDYQPVSSPPKDGDIIFQGKHPGVVQGSGVLNYHFGRRVVTPLRRLRPEIVLRKLCL